MGTATDNDSKGSVSTDDGEYWSYQWEDGIGPKGPWEHGSYRAGIHSEADIYVGSKGLSAEASVLAGAEGKIEGSHQLHDHAAVRGEATAMVGGNAEVSAGVGMEGVKAEAEAFAGAKVGASGGAEVAGVYGGVGGEVWAGAGVTGGAEVGMSDGKITVGLSAGAGLGVGGKVSLKFEIDPAKTAAAIQDAGEGVWDFIRRRD